MRIVLHSQKIKPEQHEYIQQTLDTLEGHTVELYVFDIFAQLLQEAGLWRDSLRIIQADIAEITPSYAITLGGDGTILQLVTLLGGYTLPIMGINMGRMGFLASIEKRIIPEAIDLLLDGEYVLDKRSMLSLQCTRSIFSEFPYALNDMAIFKRETSSMITIHVYIDDRFFTTYWADGIVVSTPTGSTGYNLSCGGPIIYPDSDSFVITPIAPHNLSVRSVVIPDHSVLRFKMEGRSDSFLTTLDSRYDSVTEQDTITIKKSALETHLVRLYDMDFSKTIRNKLHWGIDRRN